MVEEERAELSWDPEFITELLSARMPFGKYRGRHLLHLPEAYLVWFSQKGFPAGKLGAQLSTVYEIRTNGLEYLFEDLERFDN